MKGLSRPFHDRKRMQFWIKKKISKRRDRKRRIKREDRNREGIKLSSVSFYDLKIHYDSLMDWRTKTTVHEGKEKLKKEFQRKREREKRERREREKREKRGESLKKDGK